MIPVREVEQIQKALIDTFGGVHGIRDRNSLLSALSRPFQKFDNKELYPGITDKAAALVESIITNHPFIDGNKRTGYVTMRLFLLTNGFDIYSSQEDKYQFVMDIASGKFRFEEILEWLNKNTRQKHPG